MKPFPEAFINGCSLPVLYVRKCHVRPDLMYWPPAMHAVQLFIAVPCTDCTGDAARQSKHAMQKP